MIYFFLLFQCPDPTKRLGCEEMGGYNPLRAHAFFESISWENLHLQTPPKLTPYLPAMAEDEEEYYGNVSMFQSLKTTAEKTVLIKKQLKTNSDFFFKLEFLCSESLRY